MITSTPPLSSPICSHRGSIGSDKVARTSEELQSYLNLLFKEGVVCFDVDLTELNDGTVIVGHPSSIEGVVSTSSPSVLILFAFLRQTYPYTSATLELKGSLRDNPVFVKKLEEEALALGIVDKIAVEGQPLSTGKSFFLKEFVALRDRPGIERGAYCGLPADWIKSSKATEASILAVYQSIKGVDIILPSALCFAEESVKLAIAKWFSEKKGLHDDKSSQPLIQPWVFDSQESANDALNSGTDGGLMRKFTKVISNEPILLARALRSSVYYIM